MYDADPYVAERSMEMNANEALSEASQSRLAGGPSPVGRLVRRASGRLALLLVSLGGWLVRHSLPPNQRRPRRQSDSDPGASPLSQPLA